MQVESPFSTLTGNFHLGAVKAKENTQAVSQNDGPTIIERAFENVSEHDWTELFRQIAAIANGTRLRLTVTIEADRPGPPVRIVTDPAAPALHPQDVDRLYPWRQKELVAELNRRLGRRMLNSYDVQAVRRRHRLDERPDFVFNLPGAGRRYSPAAAEWIIEQFRRDPEFFHTARIADHEFMKLRRRTPK